MNALYQRLRELDPDTFESLCFQIITERHPSLKVEKVNGVGGDKGVDIFAGNLSGKPVIWQCKYFKDGIKSKQKIKIKQSLRRAAQNFDISTWILCVPVDLDVNAHCWFQQLQVEYDGRAELGLFQAADIVRELLNRRTIRNAFFPGAVLDTAELRSLYSRKRESTTADLERVSLENINQYRQRLKDRDARFDYQITYLGEQKQEFEIKGQILTVTDENRRIEVFPRDLEALRLDPPQVTLRVDTSGAEKLRHALETGFSTKLEGTDVKEVNSTFDFLIPGVGQGRPAEILIQPSQQVRAKRFRFRVTFGCTPGAVSYSLLEFRVKAAGTKQFVLECIQTDLPFSLEVVFPLPLEPTGGAGAITIGHKFSGQKVSAVKKFVDAMTELNRCQHFELYDLERDRQFLTGSPEFGLYPQVIEKMRSVIDQLSAVATAFYPDLRLPESPSAGDLEALPMYVDLATRRQTTLDIESVELTAVKDNNLESVFLQALEAESTFRVEFSDYDLPPLFGQPISMGSGTLTFQRARIADPEKVRLEYSKAKNGETVAVGLACSGDAILAMTGPR